MHRIVILSASVRRDRKSPRVALFLKDFMEKQKQVRVEIADLKAYNFPVFDERLRYQQHPGKAALDFAEKIRAADGVVIVTPEYNGGYPASLKNAVDLLYDEWHHKPVAIAAVSSGDFAGTQLITSLVFSLWKMKALMVPAVFHVAHVGSAYHDDGTPADPAGAEKHAAAFISELLWVVEARKGAE